MNTQGELGLKAWLDEDLNSHPAIHTGLTAEVIPPEDQIISCYVGRSQRAAGPLHRLFTSIIISTPTHAGDDSAAALQSHRDVVSAVRTLLDAPDAVDPATPFNAASGLFWKGAFKTSENEGVDDGRWVTTFELITGVSTAG